MEEFDRVCERGRRQALNMAKWGIVKPPLQLDQRFWFGAILFLGKTEFISMGMRFLEDVQFIGVSLKDQGREQQAA